jgi:uncharacterized membrane protein YidH (DUF202 family)
MTTAPDDPGQGPDAASRAARPGEREGLEVILARERTNMAWTRTAIAFAATGAAILKNHLVAGLVVLALGVATWGLRLVFPPTIDDGSRPRRLLLVTITVSAVGVVALVVAFTTHSAGIR